MCGLVDCEERMGSTLDHFSETDKFQLPFGSIALRIQWLSFDRIDATYMNFHFLVGHGGKAARNEKQLVAFGGVGQRGLRKSMRFVVSLDPKLAE